MKNILLLLCIFLLSIPSASAQETKEFPWGSIETQAEVAPGATVPVVVRVGADALTSAGTLNLDLHAFEGRTRKFGVGGATPIKVEPGGAVEHRFSIEIPKNPAFGSVILVVYAIPEGGTFKEKFFAGELLTDFRKKDAPGAAKPKAAAQQKPTKPVKLANFPPVEIGQPPVVNDNGVRAGMVLNGPWKFRPGAQPTTAIPEEEWGQLWVPGSWKETSDMPGLHRPGSGDIWNTFSPEMTTGLFERSIAIPADWAGSEIHLALNQVSLNATVFVNGKQCGIIGPLGGDVDVTAAVTPGQTATIRIQVDAKEIGGKEIIAMGNTADTDIVRELKLDARGIIGDVFLRRQPTGGVLSDIFLIPSVRDKTLELRATVSGAKAGPAQLKVAVLDARGAVEKEFAQDVTLTGKNGEKISAEWPWENPRHWEPDEPNLYTAQVSLAGEGVTDTFSQRFGFREFWIDGKEFYLNGRKIRLRPALAAAAKWTFVGGNHAAIRNSLRTMRDSGFNALQLWPNPLDVPGRPQFNNDWYRIADEEGVMMFGRAPHFSIYGNAPGEVDWTPGKRAAYQQEVSRALQSSFNSPSVVMWGLNANKFGSHPDQSPLALGRKGWPRAETPVANYKHRISDLRPVAEDAIAAFKEIDPTRSIFTHHGSDVGDVNTVNMYLNMIPLQEREDWLSEWAASGDMPFMSVEFGVPVSATMNRSREYSYVKAIASEPLMTEFAAIYLGPDAYAIETDEYRASIADRYKPGKAGDYVAWQRYKGEINGAPAFQKLLELYIGNTWKSWRGWGLSGGLVPWDAGHGYEAPNAKKMVPGDPYQPGQLGTSPPEMVASAKHWWSEKGGWEIFPVAATLTAVNSPFLAYIGGEPEAFTSKDHNFKSGENFEKQAILVNDQSREPVTYEITWSAEVAGKEIGGGREEGKIASGETLKLPMSVQLRTTEGLKTQGKIKLNAKVGEQSFTDEFAFGVFNQEAARADSVAVFDPAGDTTKYLTDSGIKTTPWTGGQVSLLVAGRDALSSGTAPPAALETYVRKGGRLVVFNQDAEWLERDAGFRTSPYVTRRMFPANPGNPVLASLDSEDLRDWRGSGTAEAARKGVDLSFLDGRNRWPYGFHWGNRGSVASAAIEKPHLAGWRPMLEAEFDLMYSPLMELRLGKGLVVFSSLDFEQRGEDDPVADLLARRILNYAAEAPVRSSEAPAIFVAGDFAPFSKQLKLANVTTDPAKADLVIAAPGASDTELAVFTDRGTPILVLPHRAASAPFGVTLKKVDAFRGNLEAPDWAEAAGITASDLRRRVNSEAWVIAEGAETAADGLLGKKQVGKSTVVFCQLDPELYPVKEAAYFRYTRWRGYRALANLIGNLGGELAPDANLLAPPIETIPLPEEWQAALTSPTPAAKVRQLMAKDTGISDAAKAAVQPEFDDSAWSKVKPGDWKAYEGAWKTSDGEAVFRLTVDVPATMAGKDLQLALGDIDDMDITFWNGEKIGETKGWDAQNRLYEVPAKLVKAGPNVIAVRAFNRFGEGGLTRTAAQRFLRIMPKTLAPAYHSDYDATLWAGDNPYRYSRW